MPGGGHEISSGVFTSWARRPLRRLPAVGRGNSRSAASRIAPVSSSTATVAPGGMSSAITLANARHLIEFEVKRAVTMIGGHLGPRRRPRNGMNRCGMLVAGQHDGHRALGVATAPASK